MKCFAKPLLCLVASLGLIAAEARAQVATTITFEGTGEENGVTENGTTAFSFKGSNWSGGAVRTLGIPPLYSSGIFSYIVGSTGAQVLFDQPMTAVGFFYASGSGVPAGTARAFDSGGNEVGVVTTGGMRSFTTVRGHLV